MVTASWFLSATEARNNIVKCIAVHGEITDIENQVLLAVQRGDYEVTVNGGTPMTNNSQNVSRTFTVDQITNILTIPLHGYSTGDAVMVGSTNELPPPLMPFTNYYVIYVDINSIRLATSKQNAQAGRAISIDLDAGVTNVSLDQPGDGYLSAPSVTFSGGTPAETATARAILETYGNIYSVSLQTTGSGFVDAPSVSINAAGSGATAGTVLFKLVSTTISFGGSGFNVGDELYSTFGNVQATLLVTQVNGGQVTNAQIINPGVFTQTQLPNPLTSVLFFSTGTGSGCSLNLTVGIQSIAIATGGLNYVVPPLVTISGGGGAGATASAILAGGTVASLVITNAGTGYYQTPSVSFTSGSGATAVAQLIPTGVSSISLIDPGSSVGIPPVVTLTTPGTGATVGTVTMKVVSAQLNNAGINYTLGDLLLVSGGNGLSNCTIQVIQIDAAGAIQNFNITANGAYTAIPQLSANNVYGGTGSGASFNLDMGLNTIEVSNGGSGYSMPPVVIISGGNGQGAYAQTEVLAGAVTLATVTSSGSGYTGIPVITFTMGQGATAQANLVPSPINNMYLLDGGSGYDSLNPPNVTFTGGGGGSGAVASVTVDGSGVVTGISLDLAGSGYTTLPDVTIDPPVSGTQATATAGMLTPISTVTVTNAGSNYVVAPTVNFSYSGAQASSLLEPTGVAAVRVLTQGSNYTSNPTVTFTPSALQVDAPVMPIAIANRSFSINSIAITNTGSGYDSAPTTIISAPALGGTQAAATAVLGYGSGTFTISKIDASVDYYQVWTNCMASNNLLIRPYEDQMNSVIKYFTDLGYTITRSANPLTGNTFQWIIKW